ncbi:MAG: hypothetical protein RPT25_00400 [Cycloclasticus sp.]
MGDHPDKLIEGTRKKYLNGLSCCQNEYGVFVLLTNMLYGSDLVQLDEESVYKPLNYLQLLPYKEPADFWKQPPKGRCERYLNPKNPLGIPSEDYLGAPYSAQEFSEIRKVILNHSVYAEFMSPDNLDFIEEVDSYLNKYGLSEVDDLYELNLFRLLGVIANAIELHFRDRNRPLRSTREELTVHSSVSKFHFDGKVLPKLKVESAIKAAEALKKVLDPNLLMLHAGDISRLEELLNSLINLNARALDKKDKLEHFVYSGNRNKSNHPVRILTFRLSMFFFQVNETAHRSLVESIVKLVEPEYNQLTLNRHLDDAEQFCIGITY